jgi:hypothetical protein
VSKGADKCSKEPTAKKGVAGGNNMESYVKRVGRQEKEPHAVCGRGLQPSHIRRPTAAGYIR